MDHKQRQCVTRGACKKRGRRAMSTGHSCVDTELTARLCSTPVIINVRTSAYGQDGIGTSRPSVQHKAKERHFATMKARHERKGARMDVRTGQRGEGTQGEARERKGREEGRRCEVADADAGPQG
ncbi:hypothetical protein C8J57DRAFT_1229318 [Mycena rebaudengoi]|nr:hypothetical protein C8J57DRAFT_1229318 [Mycena rebaudengoi]